MTIKFLLLYINTNTTPNTLEKELSKIWNNITESFVASNSSVSFIFRVSCSSRAPSSSSFLLSTLTLSSCMFRRVASRNKRRDPSGHTHKIWPPITPHPTPVLTTTKSNDIILRLRKINGTLKWTLQPYLARVKNIRRIS